MNNMPKRPDRTPSKLGNSTSAFSINHVERRLVQRPVPSSEVIEGSESADWALWDEALAGQAGPKPTYDITNEEEIPDPFASVRKRRNAP